MTHSARLNGLAPSPGPRPLLVEGEACLPLKTLDFDAAAAGLYHDVLGGTPERDALSSLCQQLARLMKVRLVVLARRRDTGALAVDASSRENGLWLELQHIPERWDSGVSSHGPAGESLRAWSAIRMSVDAEGFALWRNVAVAEQIRETLALPVRADDGERVLELFCESPLGLAPAEDYLTVEGLSRRLARLLADLRLMTEQALQARALACAGTGVFVTDLEGTIVWSNEAFTLLSGYSARDVIGRNPNVLSSGQQGVRYYRELWSTIRAGKVWSGETVDRTKDGRPYVIRQTISPVSEQGRVTHYVSVHHEIGREKRLQTRLELASRLHPETGLLTRAAFDTAASRALADGAGLKKAWALVLVSARGLQRAADALDADTEDLVSALVAKRLREALGPDELAAEQGHFEYALLLHGEPLTDNALAGRLQPLAERLAEPIPHLPRGVDSDVHFGTALFPRDAATLIELRLRADRKLADEPYRRARRDAPN